MTNIGLNSLSSAYQWLCAVHRGNQVLQSLGGHGQNRRQNNHTQCLQRWVTPFWQYYTLPGSFTPLSLHDTFIVLKTYTVKVLSYNCTIMYLEERIKGENVIKCEILELKFQLSLQVKHWNQYFSVMGWV